MSGGGGAPTSPDYSGLVNAANVQQAKYNSLGDNALTFASNAYNQNLPVYQGIAGTDTANAGTASSLAGTQAAQYQQLYAPIAQQFTGAVQNYTSPDEMARARGSAMATVSDQYEQAGDAAKRSLESFGVDPSAARFGGLDVGFRTAKAGAEAAAGTQSDVNRETTGLGLDATALSLGNQTASGANSSIGAATGAGAGGTAATTNSYSPYAGALGNPLGYYGLSSNALGMQGSLTNQGFQNSLQGYQAGQQSSSGLGSLLGAGAGIGLGLLMMNKGGVVPKIDPNASRQSVPTIGGRTFGLPRGLHRAQNVPLTMKFDGGGAVPASMSPSGGAVTDDIPATVDNQAPGTPPQAHINAGEFIFDKPSTEFYGSKHLHGLMDKAHKVMGIGRHAAGGGGGQGAVPTQGTPGRGAVDTHALAMAGRSPSPPRVDMTAGRHAMPQAAFNATGRTRPNMPPPRFAQHYAGGGAVQLPYQRLTPGAAGGAGSGPGINLGGHRPPRPSGAGALGSSAGAVRSPIPGV